MESKDLMVLYGFLGISMVVKSRVWFGIYPNPRFVNDRLVKTLAWLI